MCHVMYTMQYVKTTVWYRNDLSGKSLGKRVSMVIQFQALAGRNIRSLKKSLKMWIVFCSSQKAKINHDWIFN